MQIIETVAEMTARRDEWRAAGQRIGLVPTMGYLHDGHLSLVERSLEETDLTVVSIFVNPLQFGPKEDFSRYPRDTERDHNLLSAAGINAIFSPTPQDMYPPDFAATVEVTGITDTLEGAARPGHFKGVTTVVAKLFHIVGPQVAYFGQKDAQQLAVIQKMVRDLNFPLTVTPCPTVREFDGLAMSSRNVYLTPQERQGATVLYRALQAAKARWEQGHRSANLMREVLHTTLATEPLARPDYVSAANPRTLADYDDAIGTDGVLLSMAVRFGHTRLIDNILLT